LTREIWQQKDNRINEARTAEAACSHDDEVVAASAVRDTIRD